MGNRDLPPRALSRVFNQTAPLTARGGDVASAKKDPRVRAGARRFKPPRRFEHLSECPARAIGQLCPQAPENQARRAVFFWGLAPKPGTTWSAREVVFCE